MLGLLGTFVGMVDTLRGAVSALEGTTELAAVRAGLAADQGLGSSFRYFGCWCRNIRDAGVDVDVE